MIQKLIKRELTDYIFQQHFNRIVERLPASGFKPADVKNIFKILKLITIEYNDVDYYSKKSARIHNEYFLKAVEYKQGYRKYIDWLIDIGIIIVNEYYLVGKQSKAYFINVPQNLTILEMQPYLEMIDIHLKKEKSYIERAKEYNKLVKKATYNTFESKMLKYLINFLSITDDEHDDMIQIVKSLDSGIIEQAKAVDKIYTQQYRFNYNKTNHRLDTNLTNISTHIRKYLIDKRDFVYMDIANSQPYLLGLLMNYQTGKYVSDILNNLNLTCAPEIDPDELSTYLEYASTGTLYEFFMSEYQKVTGYLINRDTAKVSFLATMYSSNGNLKYKTYVDMFNSTFPTIGEFIHWMKHDKQLFKNIYKKELFSAKNANKLLAIMMQRLESSLIDYYSRSLYNAGIEWIVTVYDAVAVPRQFKEQAHKLFYAAFPANYQPTINIENDSLLNKVAFEFE